MALEIHRTSDQGRPKMARLRALAIRSTLNGACGIAVTGEGLTFGGLSETATNCASAQIRCVVRLIDRTLRDAVDGQVETSYPRSQSALCSVSAA